MKKHEHFTFCLTWHTFQDLTLLMAIITQIIKFIRHSCILFALNLS